MPLDRVFFNKALQGVLVFIKVAILTIMFYTVIKIGITGSFAKTNGTMISMTVNIIMTVELKLSIDIIAE